jgi:hypothetical protein
MPGVAKMPEIFSGAGRIIVAVTGRGRHGFVLLQLCSAAKPLG